MEEHVRRTEVVTTVPAPPSTADLTAKVRIVITFSYFIVLKMVTGYQLLCFVKFNHLFIMSIYS